MFCVQCGKKIEDESRFCPYCGAEVHGQSSTNGQNEDAESKKKEKYLKRENIEAAVVIIGTAFVLIHDMSKMWKRNCGWSSILSLLWKSNWKYCSSN